MIDSFLTLLSDSFVGNLMRDVFWMWPFTENLHFMGLCALFGGLLAIDLRVIGVCRFIPMSAALTLIPYVIAAFAVNLVTGFMFFCGDPFRYFYNLAFQWKMALVLLAGINALWFWFGEHAKLSKLADGVEADFGAKVIAALSLAIWVGVIILGRLIPYLE
ncbi:MAG: hypothetical protein ACO280_06340 [Pseudohongiellaceae bacterium]|jgi:hypothetical protein